MWLRIQIVFVDRAGDVWIVTIATAYKVPHQTEESAARRPPWSPDLTPCDYSVWGRVPYVQTPKMWGT
jgi:hypothetical protein